MPRKLKGRSKRNTPADAGMVPWLRQLLGVSGQWREGTRRRLHAVDMVMQGGMPRAVEVVSKAQQQTKEIFGFKWAKRDTFESPASLSRMREWLRQRYGDPTRWDWLSEYGDSPILLDAGCGAAMSGLALLEPVLQQIRYVGADISPAVEVAADRFRQRGLGAGFLQANLMKLPFRPASFDIIFSEGVLHHTDSTQKAVRYLARLLKPRGRFLFYVYKKKGPLREFTDDYIRDLLQHRPPVEGWELLRPLTKLGIALGELKMEINVPERIELLDIPAGRIDLQRFFYWHVFKAYHHPDLNEDEMHHINYDWYAPKNAHRQTPEQVERWCGEAGLKVEKMSVEEAGITVAALKQR